MIFILYVLGFFVTATGTSLWNLRRDEDDDYAIDDNFDRAMGMGVGIFLAFFWPLWALPVGLAVFIRSRQHKGS